MKTIRRILPVVLVIALLLTAATGALASGTKTFITTGKVHMREEPNKDSKKLATLPKRTIFVASDFMSDSRGVAWYFGSYKDKLGWVSEKYLQEYSGKTPKPTKKPKPTPKPTARPIDYSSFKDADYYIRVTASSLNMRREPSSDYPVVAAYSNGAVLYALRTNGNWFEVMDEEKKLHGYMSAKYAEKYDPPITVEPNPVEVNLANPEDGIYYARFNPSDLAKSGDEVVLSNVHLCSIDTYDIAEIAQLKVGDTIVIDGEPIVVETLKRDGSVEINGGVDNGGCSLIAIEESNCFVVFGLDDMATYTDHGTATLPLSEAVIYSDDSDLENHVEAGIATIVDVVNSEGNWGYNEFDTTICVESGKITKIARIYTP